MTYLQKFDTKIHAKAESYAAEAQTGQLSRREFLTRATALGVTTAAAYGLLGLQSPAMAAGHKSAGGTLRMQMETKALKDPRLYDWSEMANFSRGWLEYLVEYNADGSLRGMLLESWEANGDASEYVLHIRPGVTWNNGEAFTAADVARNITGWCDTSIEGNSMASRMTSLVDTETGIARDGAIIVVDDLTVKLVLNNPDISTIISMADYPSAIVHASYDGGDPSANPVGTGPYLPARNDVGIKQILVLNGDHTWWGADVYGGPYLDSIEYIDYGTDPSAVVAAVESGEIDATYQSNGDFIDIFDSLGWNKSEAVTAATIAVRFNQDSAPYDNVEVRKALAMAVNNSIVLELGYNGLGTTAENHHVCPIHPEYAELPLKMVDPEGAKAALDAAGFGDEEFELISIDDAWQAATCDAVAAQIRDAGINIARTVLPGSTFWNDWTKYPFSATEWNMRPLGVQVLNLAYRTGVPWNESAFANEEFDTLLTEAMALNDIEERRAVMAKIQAIMQDEGVMIQPYWRSLYRHFAPHVQDAIMHPTFEHHHYKWSIST
ncbi:MAG: ABC transporter substrate-binding protein [Rhodobacteraceae bacterium]|nr:ABC transporter substrate-binding protein [Paracoccaceae bacterium]